MTRLTSVSRAHWSVSDSVIVSKPLRVAMYCVPNVPLPPPDIAANVFPSADESRQETAFEVLNETATLVFWVAVAGAVRAPDASGCCCSVTLLVPPTPQVFAAKAVYVRVASTNTGRLPLDARPPLTPAIVTVARGSLALHDNVTDSPRQADGRDSVNVTEDTTQAPGTSRPTARRFAADSGTVARRRRTKPRRRRGVIIQQETHNPAEGGVYGSRAHHDPPAHTTCGSPASTSPGVPPRPRNASMDQRPGPAAAR